MCDFDRMHIHLSQIEQQTTRRSCRACTSRSIVQCSLLKDWVTFKRMSIELPNSYSAFCMGDLVTLDDAVTNWNQVCEMSREIATMGEYNAKRRNTGASASTGYNLPPPPPPPAPPAASEGQDGRATDKLPHPPQQPPTQQMLTQGRILNDFDMYLIEEHDLDKEAVKALTRLAQFNTESKDVFMKKLESKLASGDLRKPSNFVITCTKNAMDLAAGLGQEWR